MNAFWQHFLLSLRLNARNPMALLYGYAFPLIFLAAFRVLYRHEPVPLLHHLGELLTISVLGGACFGLPTTLVSERERGVWRRYRLTPVRTWTLVANAAATRYVLVLSAGALQLAIAFALGLTLPAHPFALWVAFTCVAFSFIGLGLVIAMLADTVPAVQALGQCIFLPMLIIGGVAVPIAALPAWAQHVSAFLPGRYAVDAIQAAVTGDGLTGAGFSLFALIAMGLAGAIASALLFRWDHGQRFVHSSRRGWLVLVAGAWLAVGTIAEWPQPATPTIVATDAPARVTTVAPAIPTPPPAPREPWQSLTSADAAGLNYDVAPDDGVVTPFAEPFEGPLFDYVQTDVETVKAKLATWGPGKDPNPLRAVRHLLCVPAAADLLQLPSERYLPPVILARLQDQFPKDELIQALTWIALHPEDGDVVLDLSAAGIPNPIGSHRQLRERIQGYAIKFVGRLTGRLGGTETDTPATSP